MKKILILSCNTGEGHNSAAHAIEDAASARGIETVITDPISFGSERIKTWVSSGYNNIIKRTPRLFGAIYKAGDLIDKTRLKSPIYFANAIYSDHLVDYIVNEGIDAVVSTHLFGMEATTALKRRKKIDIPCYGVLTDYTRIPFFAETSLDGYFVPHEDLRIDLLKRGIPYDRIYPTGIPVGLRFGEHIGRDEARRQLGILPGKRIYLIMSGGVGCGNLNAMCDELLNIEDTDFAAYVLVGRNKSLEQSVNERYGNNPHIKVVPFTKKVNLYMEAADVMLSKPGGLSSTEAAVANVPLIHVMTIPGCETKNVEFFSSHGMSIYGNNEKDAIRKAKKLVFDPEASEKMRENQRRNTHADAAIQIMNIVENG